MSNLDLMRSEPQRKEPSWEEVLAPRKLKKIPFDKIERALNGEPTGEANFLDLYETKNDSESRYAPSPTPEPVEEPVAEVAPEGDPEYVALVYQGVRYDDFFIRQDGIIGEKYNGVMCWRKPSGNPTTSIALTNGETVSFYIPMVVMESFRSHCRYGAKTIYYKDGNAKNWHLSNMRWKAEDYMHQGGTHAYGISDEELYECFALDAKGWSRKKIARELRCSYGLVSTILRGKARPHLLRKWEMAGNPAPVSNTRIMGMHDYISDEDAMMIFDLRLKEKMSYKEIRDFYADLFSKGEDEIKTSFFSNVFHGSSRPHLREAWEKAEANEEGGA